MRVLIVGSITRDTNIFDGVAQHTFGGTALYAARTYQTFGVGVRLVSRLASEDRETIAAELPGIELIAQSSAVTTTFENSYAQDDDRTQRVTAVAAPVEYRSEYFANCDWLHLGPLHPLDLHDDWLNDQHAKPAGLDLQGFARRIDGERVIPDVDPRVVDLLPRLTWLKASRNEWHTLQHHLHIAPMERPTSGAIETLVTDGAAGGVLLRNGQRDVQWSAAPPVQDCDPTGAGDVFFAAYLFFRTGKRAHAGRAAADAARFTSDFLLRRRDRNLASDGAGMRQRVAHVDDTLPCSETRCECQYIRHRFRQMYDQQHAHDEHAFRPTDPANGAFDSQRLRSGAYIARQAPAQQRDHDGADRKFRSVACEVHRNASQRDGFSDTVERGVEECADLADGFRYAERARHRCCR